MTTAQSARATRSPATTAPPSPPVGSSRWITVSVKGTAGAAARARSAVSSVESSTTTTSAPAGSASASRRSSSSTLPASSKVGMTTDTVGVAVRGVVAVSVSMVGGPPRCRRARGDTRKTAGQRRARRWSGPPSRRGGTLRSRWGCPPLRRFGRCRGGCAPVRAGTARRRRGGVLLPVRDALGGGPDPLVEPSAALGTGPLRAAAGTGVTGLSAPDGGRYVLSSEASIGGTTRRGIGSVQRDTPRARWPVRAGFRWLGPAGSRAPVAGA